MFDVDITKLVPKFILNDKNGYAVAKAIEVALQYLNDVFEQGVLCVTDPESMPEWRLDEMTWETNCLYDYDADIETKRSWISNAYNSYKIHGTPEALIQYLSGYFNAVQLEEFWEYDGSPFHFRLTLDGSWNETEEKWVQKAVETAKNVRSVLDVARIGTTGKIAFSTETDTSGYYIYPFAGDDIYSGDWTDDLIV